MSLVKRNACDAQDGMQTITRIKHRAAQIGTLMDSEENRKIPEDGKRRAYNSVSKRFENTITNWLPCSIARFPGQPVLQQAVEPRRHLTEPAILFPAKIGYDGMIGSCRSDIRLIMNHNE